jgi:hypothetical protein
MIYLETDREFAPYVNVQFYVKNKKFEIVVDVDIDKDVWVYLKKPLTDEKESKIYRYKRPRSVSKIFRASYF